MVDSIMLIGAGLAGLVLIVFAAGAVVSMVPALVLYTGELWMALFRWMARGLVIVFWFAILIVCMMVMGPV